MLWFKKDKQCDEFKKLKSKSDQLKLDLDSLNRILKEQDVSVVKEIDLVKREVADVLFNLKNEFNKKLLEFDKDMTSKIADRYFFDSRTLGDLRRAITQPFLEQKWSNTEKEKAGQVDETIKTKGEIIVQRRKEFHELKLKMEREEKDTKEISAKIQVLDFILEGAE